MNAQRLLALAAAFAVADPVVQAADGERERNLWPGVVQRLDAGRRVESWTGAGPLLFRQPAENGGTVGGFRPFWIENRNRQGDFRSGHFLYPLFSYHTDEDDYYWSVLSLIRRSEHRAAAVGPGSIFGASDVFEVWPFWFSRDTGDPALSYRALFPIAGTLKNKFSYDRLSWTLFPLYVEAENRGAVTTSTPWPFVRVTRGAAQGFGLWPLYVWKERPGVLREEYYLWPLGYNRTTQPPADAPAGTAPRHDVGALPFYARSTGPGLRDETFLWPFFGYTDRTIPYRYSEQRYLWPFLVQGRGDDRFVNRWGPFYTHSIIKGYDKRWFVWPLVRHTRWTEPEHDIAHRKTQLLFFLYSAQEQRSATRASAAPASLTHLWPLFSSWDNGAGRRQLQVLSPFEVFFPGNEKVRQAWTPLFALLRYDQRAPGEERTSLLWNAVTWERSAADARSEFHLGPLLTVQTQAGARRIAIGRGLFGFQRPAAAGGWRMFWLDFPPKPATTTLPASR